MKRRLPIGDEHPAVVLLQQRQYSKLSNLLLNEEQQATLSNLTVFANFLEAWCETMDPVAMKPCVLLSKSAMAFHRESLLISQTYNLLVILCKHGRHDIFSCLVKSGALKDQWIRQVLKDPGFQVEILRILAHRNLFVFFKILNGYGLQHNYVCRKGQNLLYWVSGVGLFYDIALASCDLHTVDIHGNTPIHHAALSKCSWKYLDLRQRGANETTTNYRNETPVDIAVRLRVPEVLLPMMHRKGIVVRQLVQPQDQQGPCCGYYAMSNSLNCLYASFPEDYESPPPPVRKSELRDQSGPALKTLGRQLDLPRMGAIYSITNMHKVLHAVNHQTHVCEINSYQSFIEDMKLALEHGYPVIVPFSVNKSDNLPNILGEGRSAHWAAVLGILDDNNTITLLVAQYGQYYLFDALNLFSSNTNMQPYPETLWFKTDLGWLMPFTSTLRFHNASCWVPENPLNDFRGRMLVVAPPNHNLDNLYGGHKKPVCSAL